MCVCVWGGGGGGSNYDVKLFYYDSQLTVKLQNKGHMLGILSFIERLSSLWRLMY